MRSAFNATTKFNKRNRRKRKLGKIRAVIKQWFNIAQRFVSFSRKWMAHNPNSMCLMSFQLENKMSPFAFILTEVYINIARLKFQWKRGP